MIKIKRNNQKGGMLLEMILMVTVLVVILPIIQAQSKKQIELSENILVVKDMLKLHQSVKGYVGEYKSDILENISSSSGTVCKVELSDIDVVYGGTGCNVIMTENILKKHGIHESSSTNVLDKTYSIYLRVVATETTQNIEVLIIGENPAEDIGAKKATNIVKELGSYGAYVENSGSGPELIGFGWSSEINSDWNVNNIADGIIENDIAILFSSNTKTGNFIAKKYVDQEDFNKMTTSIYMSLKDITGVRTLGSKYIVTNHLHSDAPIEVDKLILSADDSSKTFSFTNLYTDILNFPAYTGEVMGDNTLTLDSANTPVVNGDIYFYGEAEASSTSIIYALGASTERFLVRDTLTLEPNSGIEVLGYVRADDVTATTADVHMIFGDTLYANGNIETRLNSSYYIDTSTSTARFNSLVISDASEGLANKTLYKTSFAANSTFTEMSDAFESANAKMGCYIVSDTSCCTPYSSTTECCRANPNITGCP